MTSSVQSREHLWEAPPPPAHDFFVSPDILTSRLFIDERQTRAAGRAYLDVELCGLRLGDHLLIAEVLVVSLRLVQVVSRVTHR